MRVRADVPPLRRARLRRILAHAFWRMHRGQRRRVHGFRICHYSIQNDHVHLLVEASHARALSRGMQGLSVSIAKRINNAVGRRGSVWAERYDARELGSPTQVRNALVYVLQNGRHHPMGPDREPVPPGCLDACSSAPYFEGWRERGIPRAPPEDDPPIAAPHTWLLREGWRKAGPISIHDSPAENRARAGRRRRA